VVRVNARFNAMHDLFIVQRYDINQVVDAITNEHQ
jgi:hypothetical protein